MTMVLPSMVVNSFLCLDLCLTFVSGVMLICVNQKLIKSIKTIFHIAVLVGSWGHKTQGKSRPVNIVRLKSVRFSTVSLESG